MTLKRTILILILALICDFILAISQINEGNSDFLMIDSFQVNNIDFRTDSIELKNVSTEGGVLYIHQSRKFNFLVFEFWIYGELGKYNWIYFTDKDDKIMFVCKYDYKYDKPFYEKDYIIDKQTKYFRFDNQKILRIYSAKREMMNINDTLKKESDELINGFKEMTKDIKLEK